MRVLIIDDAPDFRALARRFIKIEWPDATVTEYDPIALGLPDAGFAWGGFDAVLLDFMLGLEDGLTWLRAFRKIEGMPPIIFMTGSGSEDVAAKAIKLGAADYLRKHDLSRARLADSIRDAISEAFSETAARHSATQRIASMTVVPPASCFSVRTVPGVNTDDIQINGYRMLRKLGEGGMAVVYLAEHLASGEERVLKILDTRLSTDPDFLDRFIREYGVISKISSPYVIRIDDQGFTNDHAYISMEHLPGGDLKERVMAGLSPAESIRIFCQLMQALEAVHAVGIVHRDVKPHNVMFRADQSIALLDFGVAKEVDASNHLTQVGIILGTPLYMSPEQGAGRVLDHRSDLYSAGVMLYEMLTGNVPYLGSNAQSVIYQHFHAPVPVLAPPLAQYQPLLKRLMAKQPVERFQSAHEALAGAAALAGAGAA